jgi:TRAP-type C4-dicarboxylate transport system permease small subunit
MAWLAWIIEGFSKLLFMFCAITIVALALAVTFEVISRYVFGSPTIWVTELSSYALVAVAFLGAAWTLGIDGHIRMELLGESGGPRGKFLSDLAMYVVAIAVAAALLYSGYFMVAANYQFGWRSSTILAVPLWIPQSIIPLGALAILLQASVGLVRTLTGARPVNNLNSGE